MARTKRNVRGTFADGGAVFQEGKLPIYDCLTCGREVVWATSSKTGRKYLVNVTTGESGSRFYRKDFAHKCETAPDFSRQLQEQVEDDALGVIESIYESLEGRSWSRTLRGIDYLVNESPKFDLAAASFDRRYGAKS